MALARYKRPFTVDGIACEVVLWSRLDGIYSELRIGGVPVATDYTPATGPDSVRNHRLAGDFPGGPIEAEAGYISWVNMGIAVHRDGRDPRKPSRPPHRLP